MSHAWHCSPAAPPRPVPAALQEALAHFAFDDLESAMRAHDGLRRGGIRKAPQQYIDEGLVQHVLLLCVRLQSARLALAALRLLERSLSSIPVPPEEVRKLPLRPTAATGVRVPLASTYLSAIHACAGALWPPPTPAGP